MVIAFEDRATGQRALKLYARLVGRLSAEFRFSQSLVRFDGLQVQSVREAAVGDAAPADMVILSLHGDRPLPDQVASWLESCETRERERGQATALIVLLDPTRTPDDSTRWCEYLRGMAARVGMDLFIHTDGSAEVPDELPWLDKSPGMPALWAEGSGGFKSTPRRWGINE